MRQRAGGQARDEDCDRCGHRHGDRHGKPARKPKAQHPGNHDRQNDCWLSSRSMYGSQTNLEEDSRQHGVGERSGNRCNEPTQWPYLPTGDDQGGGCDQTANRGRITARLRARGDEQRRGGRRPDNAEGLSPYQRRDEAKKPHHDARDHEPGGRLRGTRPHGFETLEHDRERACIADHGRKHADGHRLDERNARHRRLWSARRLREIHMGRRVGVADGFTPSPAWGARALRQ